jgi:peptide/nickel transport system permease protein
VLQGVPGFVITLLLIQIFAVSLLWLPSTGYGGTLSWVLPVAGLASFLAPKLARVIAANVGEAMREDYIRTARAIGASEREVLWRHALPNALLGAAALIGAQFAFLLGGSVVTESIFSWPGLGWHLLKSTQTLDFPVVQAIAVFIAVLVFTVTALTDLSFRLLDPRLRVQTA